MVTEPAASTSTPVLEFVRTGSYTPNAILVELIVQLAATLAVTWKFDVLWPANAGVAENNRSTARPGKQHIRSRFTFSSPFSPAGG